MTENKQTRAVEVRSLTVEVRAAQEGRIIEGYAAKFEKWSDPIWGWFREKIARGAFEGCDMSDTIACFNHDPSRLLARTSSGTLALEVDAIGLRFSFEAPNTTDGNNLLEMVRRGDISKCSFRFSVSEENMVYADAENGLQYDERTIVKFDKLHDVSLVVYPAYPDTEAQARYKEQRSAATTAPDAAATLENQNKDSSQQYGSDERGRIATMIKIKSQIN